MKPILKLFLAFFSILALLGIVWAANLFEFNKKQTPGLSLPDKYREFADKLSLEQKIGQLLLIGFEGKKMTPQLENLIKTIHPGGVLLLSRNIDDEVQLKKLTADLQETALADTGLPLFVAADQEGEPLSRVKFLSEKTPQSEIRNEAEAFEVGLNRGKELESLGINLNLAPVLDAVEPNDFLFERSFQKDAGETGELAKALISGQRMAGILTAIKHFPGYAGISFNPERVKLPVLSDIPQISQFEKALEAQPEMVMTANVIYGPIDGNFPFTLSAKGIQFLKNELGDNFLIISDDLSSPVLKKEISLKNTVVSAVKSGINILIVAGFDEPQDPLSAFNFLADEAKNGQISRETINESVLKIIELKQKMIR
jgi:beta-N-acetylhexosaminidase